MSDDVRERHEIAKLAAVGRAITNAEKAIRYTEEKELNNDRRHQMEEYNSVVQYCVRFGEKQGVFQGSAADAFQDIAQTQNQMNKCLSKLFF